MKKHGTIILRWPVAASHAQHSCMRLKDPRITDRSMIRGTYLAIAFYWILSAVVCRSVRLLSSHRRRSPRDGTWSYVTNSRKYSSNRPTLPTLVCSRRKQKTCKRRLLCKSRANKTALELQQPMLVASAAAVVSVPTVLCRLTGLGRHRNVHLLDSDLIYHTVASVNCRRHDVS